MPLSINDFYKLPIEDNLKWIVNVAEEVIDNGEEIVDVVEYSNGVVKSRSMYHELEIPGAFTSCRARRGVVERLAKASNLLPLDMEFVVFDGYRPYAVQHYLFDSYHEKFMGMYPTETPEQLLERTKIFVSDPDNSALPHMTGGAVDLAIQYRTGKLLDFGTGYDDLTPLAALRYFERHPKENPVALQNRRLLFHILQQVDMTNYKPEWWHFDYGNIFWGQIKGQKPFYRKQLDLESQ